MKRKVVFAALLLVACHSLDCPMNLFFITSSHPLILRLVWRASGRTSTAFHLAG
jgi:hypothetical protein